ncbi:hypothetical protein H6K86_11885 [Staphylococcus epidermidis]|jgi:hypothetical protein|nr:hypothetical protein [Staphylococcus epidermidis]MBM6209921.1 hypothetical protein [Staphylococcus epidermidis]MBM6212309.1 hypothetical protein [Staphylococcus epidermidis]MBM6219228.1 hypothetical protein [Staphylococcus epidermidis]MBM6223750.1 hypothetical protein [Staphylococcus epidermidis]
MTKSESLTAKVILDNETYEFSIEDGETLQLELKHVNQKIFVQKKEVSQLYPNGQPRIAFNDSKANVTTPLAFADQEFESSINDILEEQTQNKVDISEQKIEEDSGEELNKNSEDLMNVNEEQSSNIYENDNEDDEVKKIETSDYQNAVNEDNDVESQASTNDNNTTSINRSRPRFSNDMFEDDDIDDFDGDEDLKF